MADDAGRDLAEAQRARSRALHIDWGRSAYEGYRDRTGGKTWDLRPMPLWDELPVGVQDAWCEAALAVVSRVARFLNNEVAG